MDNLTGSNQTPDRASAVALGLFDGLHLGHQAVIHQAVDFIPQGLAPAVFTFETDTVTTKGEGGSGVDVILAADLKHEFLDKLGVQYLYSPDFLNFKHLTGREFVRLVLHDKLRARYVVCGEDFRFGRGGSCGLDELREMGAPYGMEVVVVPPAYIGGEVVSSTRIRRHIKAGEMEEANRLLGYDFTLRLPVQHGNQLGRTLNFPTINQLLPQRQVVPRFGVYSSHTLVEGKAYHSVTNVGIKPTVGGESWPLAETFLLDFQGDLYGQNIQVKLHSFLRPEQRFSGLEELAAQMGRDIESVRRLAREGTL